MLAHPHIFTCTVLLVDLAMLLSEEVQQACAWSSLGGLISTLLSFHKIMIQLT